MSQRVSVILVCLVGIASAREEPPEPEPEPEPVPDVLKSVKLRGRIQADAVMASQSNGSEFLIGTLVDGYGLRRARIGAQGNFGTSTEWVAEADFAGGLRLADFYIGLDAIPSVNQVRVGYFREPFSLDGATSSNVISFMERSPLNQFDPARNWGVAGSWLSEDSRASLAVGGFRDDTSTTGISSSNQGCWAVTSRATVLPIYESTDESLKLIHLGAAFSYRVPLDGVVNYTIKAQSSLLDTDESPTSPFLPEISVPAGSYQLYNLQAATVLDSFSLQGEWFGTAIQQTGGSIVFLHGFYVYASWFLTGEHRGYSQERASFSDVKVTRPVWKTADGRVVGCGAWELAARFALADFTSPNLPISTDSNVQAGAVLYQATLGINWYLNDHTRVMFNYNLAAPAIVGFPTLPVHVFGVRTAIYW